MTKIILTFDDNKWNHYYTVFPLLKKYNLKATFAYITQGTFTEKESNNKAIQEMLDYGIEITSHSHTHPKFDINLNSEEFLINDLVENRKILNSHKIYSYGLILPYNCLNVNYSIFDSFNLKYIVHETSTINNFNPSPKNKLYKFTKSNNLNETNLRRIEFPLDSQPNTDLKKFYEIIKNLKDDDVCAIMFHNISNRNIPYNVRENIFENFLKFLVENKYNVTTIESLYT